MHTTRLAATLAATLLLAAGCSSTAPAAQTTAPTTPPAAATTPPGSRDSAAQQACTAVAAALTGDGTRDAAKMRQTGETAQQATDPEIRSYGLLLTRAASRAEAAAGAADEPAMVAGMVTAVTNLSTACIAAGLPG